MRAPRSIWFAVAGLTLAAVSGTGTGCKWSEFDDLESEAWVASTERDASGPTIWPVALVPGPATTAGGTLVTIGSAEPTYAELDYSDTGGITRGDVHEYKDDGYSAFSLNVVVIENPATDEIAVITQPTTAMSVALVSTGALVQARNIASAKIDGATYVRPAVGAAPEVIVASERTLYSLGTDVAARHACVLDTPYVVRALGAVVPPGTGTEELLLVWAADGNLSLFSPAELFASACAAPPTPVGASLAVPFQPTEGSEILDFRASGGLGGNAVLLVGRNALGSFLQVVTVGGDVTTPTLALAGTSAMTAKSDSATILSLPSGAGGGLYVAVGYKNQTVSNVSAGQVQLHAVDVITGVNPDVALVLNDADPEDGQQFGRTITALPYNDGQILAVGADGEIFTYFQTELYDETRRGR